MNLKIPFLMASAAACLACAAETVVVSKVSGVSPANRTAEFQKEIDELSAAGGGTLHIPAGEYVVASLRLKDGVTLHLDKNAYLFGSSNECEYVRYKNDGDTAYSVIYADGAKDVAVEGDGVIDGRGALHNRKAKGGRSGPWDDALSFQYSGLRPGWDDLYFHDCRNVRVEGVTLRNASSWCCFFRGCDGVVARRVKIFNHCNPSNDGMDIESANVLVEDCDIDSEDDSLVLKAREPGRVVENVTVRRCRLSCNAEHIKIGTETLGTFRNILVEDCDVACRTPKAATSGYLHFPNVLTSQAALSAISLFLMDGGSVENVTIRRIAVGEGIVTPICIRYGDRRPRRLPGEGFFRNVLIEDVKMSAPSVGSVACSITGQPDKRPQNITLRNVELLFKGGGRAEDAAQKIVEEYPARYPAPFLVFETMFPAYAFYLRHADGIRFENVKLEVLDPDEARPPIVADDATYELTSAIGARAGDPGPWAGKKVAFLGDSITDPDQTNRPQRVYWQYLADSLGLEPHVYAVSGYQWDRVYESAQKMKDEMGQSVDAIFVFAGTNDYMNGIPLGEWFEEAPEETYLKGKTLTLPRRRLVKDMTTFKGRVNTVMEFLKTNFPDQQIVIMTPLHRGKYDLGRPNIQLDETFPNALGRRLEEYVAALREAADIWSVPVIDLYRESGLYPLSDAYAKCFRYDGPKLWDRLHPNQEGHRRLAMTIAAKLTAIPPDFKPGKDAN